MPPAEPVNEPTLFLQFVTSHKPGDTVAGEVESFSSHGAFVLVDGARCYLPLQAMGDPPPRSARELLSRGEEGRFVIQAFDPSRRGVELALPGFARVAGTPTEETVKAEIRRLSETDKAAKKTAAKKSPAKKVATKAAPAKKVAAKKEAEPAVKKVATKKAAAPKKTPAKKVVAKKEAAKKEAAPAAKNAPAKAAATAKNAVPMKNAGPMKNAVPAKKAASGKKAAPATKAPAKKTVAKKATRKPSTAS